MSDNKADSRGDYKCFYPITTRWMDNDVYGHVNNVIYYSYFDTAVNTYMINEGGFNIEKADIVGYAVNSHCNYVSSVAFPDEIEAGLRIVKIGNSSVTYGVGIFKKGADKASAYGEFVHVFVNREEKKSVPIPAKIRAAFEKILV